MGTWSIDNGASITPNGIVTIPESSVEKMYTVTYRSSDGGCECHHYITQREQQTCSCTGYGITAGTSEYGNKIGPYNDGREYNAGTYEPGTCPIYTPPRFEFIEGSGVDFVYLYAYSNSNTINCRVQRENTSSNNPRSAQYRVYFGPMPNVEECSLVLTVWQAGSTTPPGPTPTECTNWGDWGDWKTAEVPCAGGDSSAEVCRSRVCLTDPSQVDYQCETVYFTTTTCNDTGGERTVYNQDGKKVVQKSGCSCGGGSCSCSLDIDDDLPATGGTNVKVGTWSSTCSGTHSINYVAGDSIFTSIIPAANGDVIATFPENRGGALSGTYALTNGDTCYDNASAGQLAGGGGSCGCPTNIQSNLTFPKTGGTKSTTYEPSDACFVVNSKPSWITSVSISNGTISATATANTEDYRNDQITFKDDNGNTCTPQLGVAQYGGCSYTISSSINPTYEQCESCDGVHYYPSMFDVTLSGFPTGGATATVYFSAVGGGNSNNCGIVARGTGNITMSTSDGTVSASQLGLGDLNKGVSSITITKITFSDESTCNYTTGGTTWSGSC